MRLSTIMPIAAVSLTCCSVPDKRSDTNETSSVRGGSTALTWKRKAAQQNASIEIPLDVWLPPKSSWLADNFRRYYGLVINGEFPDAPVSAVLQRREGALEALFAIVDAPSLDGAHAEGYAHDLVFALIVIGDERYANALAAQTINRRRRLASQIIFGFGDLHGKVPKTEALCRKFYPTE